MRTRVVISRPVTTQNEYGEKNPDGASTAVATRWAQVRPLRGQELIDAQQVNSQTTHEVRMRFDSSLSLSSKDKLTFSGRTLEISTTPLPDELNREWVFQAVERK